MLEEKRNKDENTTFFEQRCLFLEHYFLYFLKTFPLSEWHSFPQKRLRVLHHVFFWAQFVFGSRENCSEVLIVSLWPTRVCFQMPCVFFSDNELPCQSARKVCHSVRLESAWLIYNAVMYVPACYSHTNFFQRYGKAKEWNPRCHKALSILTHCTDGHFITVVSHCDSEPKKWY